MLVYHNYLLIDMFMDTENNIQNKGLFRQVFDEVISYFSPRSQKVIRMRYGIGAEKAKTLEEIGNKYQITRERVRQIIQEIIKKIISKKIGDANIKEVKKNIVFTIAEKNGIITEKEMLSLLGGSTQEEKGFILFFLDIFNEISSLKIPQEMEPAILLPDFDIESWKNIKNSTKEILEKNSKPLNDEDLFREISIREKEIDKKKFFDFLNVSAEIKKNNFGKWGVVHWKEISPKGTREKIHLILSEIRKPLHFREIAKYIDIHKLSKKKAHPQTVHNELIKDSRFVLIGRGIYALSEWGYQKGTVKDVLKNILQNSKEPMNKDDILNKVFELRQVKKSTIIINLNNYFVKIGKDCYALKK